MYRTLTSASSSATAAATELEALRDFFQLETDLAPLHARWSRGDSKSNKNMAIICQALQGMRVARQDPVECLFSFIVSSNNNITRIGNILGHWRRSYGEHLVTTDAASHTEVRSRDDPREDSVAYFAFPTLERLAQCSKEDFYAKGTPYGAGYRAPFLVNSANKLLELGGREFLLNLRKETAPLVVREQLVSHFDGVGPKVADCVALFSLDQAGVVPLDVHVLDIAQRDFGHTEMWQKEKTKSLTASRMAMINACFHESFGDYAGWAHSLLFAAELKVFEAHLPQTLIDEIHAFKEAKSAEKKALKAEKKARKAAAAQQNGSGKAKAKTDGDYDEKEKNRNGSTTKKKNKKNTAGAARGKRIDEKKARTSRSAMDGISTVKRVKKRARKAM